MLEYSKTDISEGIDINKTNASKECCIYRYWYFLNKKFKYEPYLCNDCHGLMQKIINANGVTMVPVKGSDYRIHFWYMSMDDAISKRNNSDLNDRGGVL